MAGIYLQCDKCGATLGGEEVTTREHGLHWSERETLIIQAIALGWACTPLRDRAYAKPPYASLKEAGNDFCPTCAEELL